MKTITLNTLTSALEEATAAYYVCVGDETILNLRNALVDIAKSNENGGHLVQVEDDTEDDKHVVADSILTQACNIASQLMIDAKSYSKVTIRESDLNCENIAWNAILKFNEK